MIFRRAALRYSDTPAPVTPYQAAAQVWDERIGSARVQAHHWRLMALGALGLAFVTAGALVWRSGQSLVTPYVIEVDRSGDVRAVGEAATPYRPTDAQIAKVLGLLNSQEPVFVHCKKGADRTGTVIACYRISHDRWQRQQALKEAKSHGMGFVQVGLKRYILEFQPTVQP